MTIGYRSSYNNAGDASTGTTGTITAPTDGDLVVLYVNGNDNAAIAINSDTGAAWETELFDEQPSTLTAHHAAYWKVASSEPTEYTFDLGTTRNYRCILFVFSGGGTGWELDGVVTTAWYGTNQRYLYCTAPAGITVVDNSVSIVFGGKDTRKTPDEDYTDADGGDTVFSGALGGMEEQIAAGAYKLYTTGVADVGNIRIDTADDNDDKNVGTYSAHLSFIESAAGGSTLKSLPLLGVGT